MAHRTSRLLVLRQPVRGASTSTRVDCAGNLYVASNDGGMIRVYAPDGTELDQIAVASSLTNVAFGGSDRTTLYATAGKTLYAIQMNLPGYPY